MGLANNRNAKFLVENKAKAADGTYSIYVLSDGVIYAPKDSMDLFRYMKKLESINASGLDVSRVESLESAFRSCTGLKTLDVTGWDTSKVTNLYGTFLNCTTLETIIGLETWDTSSVTDVGGMFLGCPKLETLGIESWDLSRVTDSDGFMDPGRTVAGQDWEELFP